jgi:hypothetical protein
VPDVKRYDLVKDRSPMKRGLKVGTAKMNAAAIVGERPIPDEEGTKRRFQIPDWRFQIPLKDPRPMKRGLRVDSGTQIGHS